MPINQKNAKKTNPKRAKNEQKTKKNESKRAKNSPPKPNLDISKTDTNSFYNKGLQ